MSAGAARTRSAVLFAQYAALLAAGAVWVQLDFVRRRVGDHLGAFYVLLAGAACYLAARAWLVLTGRATPRWRGLWVSADLGIITAAVYLTGGINSEAALVYFWPIATSSIRRLPRQTLAVSAASAVLYVVATWADRGSEKYLGTVVARLVVLSAVTSLAAYYALTETAVIEELARLRAQVALADYRSRLSQEMHDGIQHYFADIVVRLELARKLMAADPVEAAKLATDQRFTVRQAAAELRYLVRLLRSPAVEREGFVEALRHHLSVFAEAASISAPLEVEGDLRALPPEVAHTAFRIVQEAVMNAEKHARATEVRVVLRFREGSFACCIQDNGVGFDPATVSQAAAPGTGFGLPGMAQRAALVGGTVEVRSAPGAGTVVTFTAPAGGSVGRPGL